MEAKPNSRKAKERLLTFLLIFLVLLVPLSIFSSVDRALVEVTNVQIEEVDETTSLLFLTLRNRVDCELDCELEITTYRNEQVYTRNFQTFGHLQPKQSKVGYAVLNFPDEDYGFDILPACIKLP
jgi:hypothetical protein